PPAGRCGRVTRRGARRAGSRPPRRAADGSRPPGRRRHRPRAEPARAAGPDAADGDHRLRRRAARHRRHRGGPAGLPAPRRASLVKDGSPASIGTAIMEMVEGGSPISAPIARYLLKRFRPGATGISEPAASESLPRLSERERDVLTLIVKGFSYAEAARLMRISPHTVTAHVRSIYGKLEVHSRGEAVYEALQLGLVKLDE